MTLCITNARHLGSPVDVLVRDGRIVTMTPAGATWPYGRDPQDTSIRIAPTFPSLHDLEAASRLFCLCVKIVSLEKMLKEN